MSKIKHYLKQIVILTFVAVLTGCSTSGESTNGLGLDVSGKWFVNLFETNVNAPGGTFQMLLSNGTASLSPSLSLTSSVNGTFSYNNALTGICSIGGVNGTVTGSIVGNKIVFSLDNETEGFTLSFAGITSNNAMQGDWNLIFVEEIPSEDPEADPETFNCGMNGTLTGTKS